jgi:hypothetical protein
MRKTLACHWEIFRTTSRIRGQESDEVWPPLGGLHGPGTCPCWELRMRRIDVR